MRSIDRTPALIPGLVGRVLGDFVVGERIGRGGFADVHRARQLSLERDAVIKVLRLDAHDRARRIARFEQEARLASQLDHPFAAHVYAFGSEPDGLLWIAMELVRGTTLRELVRKNGTLPLSRFVPLFERLCEVVHSAHVVGLVHRDIKLENVMVIARAGRLLPKLLDFGIARMVSPSGAPMTSGSADDLVLRGGLAAGSGRPSDDSTTIAAATGSAHGELEEAIGTPAYMAPEQWTSAASADFRIDIYSLGVLAHYCLSGKLPFQGKTWRDYMSAHLTAAVPLLGEELPRELDAVIARALAKAPEDRYGSALELAAAVRQAANLDGVSAAIPRLDEDATQPLLLAGPPPIAHAIAMLEAARSIVEASLLVDRLVRAVSVWIGVVALAARASTLDDAAGEAVHDVWVARLRSSGLTAAQWLELARAQVAACAEDPQQFPLAELASWLGQPELELLRALGEAPTGDIESGSRLAARIAVASRVLRSLAFLIDYPVLVAGRALNGVAAVQPVNAYDALPSIALADGDGVPLFALSPLVAYAPPAPGERPELFTVIGPGRRGTRMTALARGFERDDDSIEPYLAQRFGALAHVAMAGRDDQKPYRGLASFTADDAELYFGRDHVIELLHNRVLIQPLVLVTGPSGSGKSSLLSAGLLPRLADGSRFIQLRPGRAPMTAVKAAVMRHGASSLESLARDAAHTGTRLVVVVDQGEELFTAAAADEAAAFATALADAMRAGDHVRIVVALRDDYLHRIDALEPLRPLLGSNVFVVSSPTRAELEEILVEPAHRVGYRFEDLDMVAAMVDEVVGHAGALPLLSFAALRLWESRDEHEHVLTRRAYELAGGVGGALAKYADRVVASLSARDRAVIRALLRNLVTAEGTRVVSSRAELVAQVPGSSDVLERMIESRLLVSSESADGSEQIEIIHEALVERWPQLAAWRRDDADALRTRDELRAAAKLWDQHERAPSYLWRGQALDTLRRWREQWSEPLPAVERAFATSSFAAHARQRRLRRTAIAGAVLALSATIAVLAYANHRTRQSEHAANASVTDLLSDRGRRELVDGNALRGLVYLSEAYSRGADSPGLRVAMAYAGRSLDRMLELVPGDRDIRYLQTADTPDGPIAVTAHTSGRVQVWSFTSGRLVKRAELTLPPGDSVPVIVPKQRSFVTLSMADHKLRTWTFDGVLVATSEGTAATLPIALARDETHIATGYSEIAAPVWGDAPKAAVWDIATARLVWTTAPLGPPAAKAGVRALDLAFDGSTLVTNHGDGVIRIWKQDAPAPVAQCGRPSSVPRDIAPVRFSRDGRFVIGATSDGSLWFCDVASGEHREYDGRHVRAIAVSETSDLVAITGGDDQVHIWDPQTGERSVLRLRARTSPAELSPDGQLLAATSADGALYLWSTERWTQAAIVEAPFDLKGAAFLGSGHAIGVGAGGELAVWKVGPDQRVLAGHRGKTTGIQFSPDGRSLATISLDRTARIWEVATGASRTFALDAVPPRGQVAFSRDGKRLALNAGPMIDAAPPGSPTRKGGQGQVIDVASGKRLWLFGAGAVDLEFTPAGTLLATNNLTRSIVAWGPDGTQLFEHAMPRGELAAMIEVSPNRDVAVFGYRTGLSLLNLTTRMIEWSVPATTPTALSWSGDGRRFAVVGHDGFITIRDGATGAIIRRIKQPMILSLSVALSPDGELVAVGGITPEISVWETRTGRPVVKLAGHRDAVLDLDFSPDGRYLASASADGTAMLWPIERETRTPAEVARLVEQKVMYRLDGVDLVPK